MARPPGWWPPGRRANPGLGLRPVKPFTGGDGPCESPLVPEGKRVCTTAENQTPHVSEIEQHFLLGLTPSSKTPSASTQVVADGTTLSFVPAEEQPTVQTAHALSALSPAGRQGASSPRPLGVTCDEQGSRLCPPLPIAPPDVGLQDQRAVLVLIF